MAGWLHTDAMDINLDKLWEKARDRELCVLHGVHRKSDTIGQVNNNDFIYFGQGAKSGIARHTSMFFKKVPIEKQSKCQTFFSSQQYTKIPVPPHP